MMRKVLIMLSTTAFALGGLAAFDSASAHKMLSHMGCKIGWEKWDASVGKCVSAKMVRHHRMMHTMKHPKSM
jgi:hypothetical protein